MLVTYPAALDLPHALVEWLTVLIVTREGDRRCKLPASQRALITLVYLRKHDTLAHIAAGFRISESTAHAYVHSVITHLAPVLPRSPARCGRHVRSTCSWTARSPSATASATARTTTPASTASTA